MEGKELDVDHDVALRQQAAERYTLGELEGGEREGFEEHFMTCEACAADVRALTAFVENAREVFRTESLPGPEAEPKPSPWMWIFRPAMAWGAVAAFAIAVAGYQSLVVVPDLRSPHAVQSAVLKGESRGDPVVLDEDAAEPLVLSMDVNAPAPANKYAVEIDSAAGKPVLRLSASAQPDHPLSIFVPAGTLKPGRYNLVVHNATSNPNGPELGRYPFEIRTRQEGST